MITLRKGQAVAAVVSAFATGVVLSAIIQPLVNPQRQNIQSRTPPVAAALPELEPQIEPLGTLEELLVPGGGLVWTTDEGLSADAQHLINQIRLVEFEGLDPQRYHINALNNLSTRNWNKELKEPFEQLLTAAYKQLIIDLGQGVLTPSRTQRSWFQTPQKIDAHAEFESLVAGTISVQDSIAKHRPAMDDYERLSYALSSYQIIRHNGGWPTIPAGVVLKAGVTDPRVPTLRERLSITNDLEVDSSDPEALSSELYSDELVAAVKKFQRRHGLDSDGVIGPGTIRSLNEPVADKVNKLLANLERMRWLPRDLGKRHVITNIAEYSLSVVNDGQKVLTMPIVAGQPKYKTPIFSDTMEYLVVNPNWTVPRSITYRELLPLERKNPGYLARKNFELITEEAGGLRTLNPNSLAAEEFLGNKFRYTIRQKPGSNNALGKVKFIFPNPYSIYLHDTQAKSLFKKNKRAYSHGCIRLGDPKALAHTLLGYEGWKRSAVDAVFKSNKTRRISLKEPIPNHIIYLTTWVVDGEVQFREDIYGHDKDLAVALSNPSKARWPASLFASLEE